MGHNVTTKKYKGLILAIVICIAVLCSNAFCREDYASICLQKTPQQGGTINIGAGVHDIPLNTEITLIAVPEPGYQFVYWLGDVSDPVSNNTTAYIDSPKFIIAVFEKAEHEFMTAIDYAQRSGGGRGRLKRTAADYQRQGGGGGGGRRPRKFRFPTLPEPEPDELSVPGDDGGEDEFLVPGDGVEDELPVPGIPEPATVILMGLGSLLLTGKRKVK